MGSYANKIRHLHPTALDSDFQLEDNSDGNGPYLSLWNAVKLGTQPTLAALDLAVSDSVANNTAVDKDKQRVFDGSAIKAMGLTLKTFMNEIMAGRIDAITNAELKAEFKSHL